MIRKRGDNWTVTVYDRRLAKKVWLGTYPKKGKAQDAERDYLTNMRAAGRWTPETVAQFAARWMDDYPRAKESTTLHYRQQIKALVTELGDEKLAAVTRPMARTFALAHRAGFPAARAMFSDAHRDGLVDANPFVNMRLSESRGRKDLVVPTEAEVMELAAKASVHGAWGDRVYRNLILFAAFTGMRPGEIHGLDWRHIDFQGDTVWVERQWNPKLRKMTSPKNGRERTIYLNPTARQALEALPRSSDAIFPTPSGARLGGQVSHYYFHPVRCAFGRPDLDFYSLRHFYGTHLALLGLGAPEIAQALGHTDGGKLALSRYIHVTAQDSRAKIARAFGSTTPPLRAVPGSKRVANGGQTQGGSGL